MYSIKDILDKPKGTQINGLIAYIKTIEKRFTQSNDIYYHLILADKDLHIEARVWSDSFSFVPVSKLKTGDVISISGSVNIFNGTPQIIIEKAHILQESEYDESLLFPLTSSQIAAFEVRLFEYINEVSNVGLKNTLLALFQDEKIHNLFIVAPGGEIVHHAYRGGLLEHTLEVTDIALSIYKHYQEFANRDVIIAGALLHDIGKIFEYDKTTFKRTIHGYLLGHIVMGMQVFNKFWDKYSKSKDEKLRAHVIHIILSHHSELEQGAVVRPATLEAAIVAQADYASSTVKQFAQDHAKVDPELGIAPYNKFLRTKVIKLD